MTRNILGGILIVHFNILQPSFLFLDNLIVCIQAIVWSIPGFYFH